MKTTTTGKLVCYTDVSGQSHSPGSLPSAVVLPILLWLRKQENSQSGSGLSCHRLNNSVCPVHIGHSHTPSACTQELSPPYTRYDYLMYVFRHSTLDPAQNIDFNPVSFWQQDSLSLCLSTALLSFLRHSLLYCVPWAKHWFLGNVLLVSLSESSLCFSFCSALQSLPFSVFFPETMYGLSSWDSSGSESQEYFSSMGTAGLSAYPIPPFFIQQLIT